MTLNIHHNTRGPPSAAVTKETGKKGMCLDTRRYGDIYLFVGTVNGIGALIHINQDDIAPQRAHSTEQRGMGIGNIFNNIFIRRGIARHNFNKSTAANKQWGGIP